MGENIDNFARRAGANGAPIPRTARNLLQKSSLGSKFGPHQWDFANNSDGGATTGAPKWSRVRPRRNQCTSQISYLGQLRAKSSKNDLVTKRVQNSAQNVLTPPKLIAERARRIWRGPGAPARTRKIAMFGSQLRVSFLIDAFLIDVRDPVPPGRI